MESENLAAITQDAHHLGPNVSRLEASAAFLSTCWAGGKCAVTRTSPSCT